MNDPPRPLWSNSLTATGSALAVLSLLFILCFLLIDLTAEHPNPYVGLFTYLIFPGVFALALAILVTGLWLARRHLRRKLGAGAPIRYLPWIDLNDARHRRAFGVGGVAVGLAVPFIGVMSYEGYHYTDSNQFCGAVCHSVMEPQYTAYRQSPHAHVACAECHIGPGASWYVKSKLSGLRQVWAVTVNSFPRPIPPAIKELRPATETCQQCHWPAKFFGDQLVTIHQFASDESNTHSQIRMLLRTGGSDPSTGPPSGIHWHMALGFRVEYVAVDEHLQEIPWVQTTDLTTGRSTIYRADGLKSTDPPPTGIRRTVDCMDCHNRPTHIFRSPDHAADLALHVNANLQSLPFAKRELVAALVKPYGTKSEGLAGVPRSIEQFYQDKYASVWAQHPSDVEQLGKIARDIYQTYFFPQMNVSWRTYPDNIGHKIYPGCFRCHEGRHVDDAGKPISHECGTCHEFLMTVPDSSGTRSVVQTGGFVHPVELQGTHALLRCSRCHTGGVAPSATCTGCHTLQTTFRNGKVPEFNGFSIHADSMASVDCEGCHDLSKPMELAVMNERCLECHQDDADQYKNTLASWQGEADQLLKEADRDATAEHKRLVQLLRDAGPLHNMEATRRITKSIVGNAPYEGTR